MLSLLRAIIVTLLSGVLGIVGRLLKSDVHSGSRSAGNNAAGAGEGRNGQNSGNPKTVTDVNFLPEFPRPARLDYLLSLPPASREDQLKHAWNPEDRSLNIYVMVSLLAPYFLFLNFHILPMRNAFLVWRGSVLE